MSAVFAYPDFAPHEKLVMLALADHADELNECFPSIARLVRMTGMSERGVQQVIRRLEQRGFIVTRSNAGRKGSNRFRLCLPVLQAPSTPAPGAPPHPVPPAPGAPYPRTRCTLTPAPGAPKPSINHQEPCAPVGGRAREAKRRKHGNSDQAPVGDRNAVLMLFAEKINAGRYVAPSALSAGQVREMRERGLVTEESLKRSGLEG